MFSSFSKLFSYSLISSLITFSSSFFLAYFYSPGDFGEFSLYFAIANILSGFLFMRADFLVAKRKELEKYAYSLLIYSTILALFISLPFILLFSEFIKGITIIVWSSAIALSSLATYMCIRRGLENLIGYMRLANAVSISLLQIVFSFSNANNGLIFGSLIGVIISHTIPFLYLRKKNYGLLSFKKTFGILKRNFKYSFPSTMSWLFDAVLLSLIPVVINIKYGAVIAGYYVFADRVIKSPVSVLTSTLSPIIVGCVSKGSVTSSRILKLILMYALIVLMLSVVSYYFFGDIIGYAVIYLWGSKWDESSTIISLVIIYHLLYMYNVSTMYIYHHYSSVNIYITIQFLFMVGVVSIFFFSSVNWKMAIEFVIGLFFVVFFTNLISQIYLLKRGGDERLS